MKILIAISLILFVEAIIYVFFAFCNWNIYWPPEVGGFTRFIYALMFLLGLAFSFAIYVTIIDDKISK